MNPQAFWESLGSRKKIVLGDQRWESVGGNAKIDIIQSYLKFIEKKIFAFFTWMPWVKINKEYIVVEKKLLTKIKEESSAILLLHSCVYTACWG